MVYSLVYFFFIEGNYKKFDYRSLYQKKTVAPVTILLASVNNSGESGRAVLVEENGKTTVTLSLSGFKSAVAQPAHIHVGDCPGVGAVRYPLNNIVNGKSATTLAMTIAQLRGERPLAINVHKSANEAKVYVSCGAI